MQASHSSLLAAIMLLRDATMNPAAAEIPAKMSTSPELLGFENSIVDKSPYRSLTLWLYSFLYMSEPKNLWKQPSGVAIIAILFIVNLAVDWWLFRPKNLALFLIVELLILGIIIWLATNWRRRSLSP